MTIELTEEDFKNNAPRPVAQGEVYIWMEKYAPAEIKAAVKNGDFKKLEPENGQLIIGHSETGHHHVLEPQLEYGSILDEVIDATIEKTKEQLMKIKTNVVTKINHLRSNHTHENYSLPAGDYIVKGRQEQTQDGLWVRSAD